MSSTDDSRSPWEGVLEAVTYTEVPKEELEAQRGAVLVPSCWAPEFDSVPQINEPAIFSKVTVKKDGTWEVQSVVWGKAPVDSTTNGIE